MNEHDEMREQIAKSMFSADLTIFNEIGDGPGPWAMTIYLERAAGIIALVRADERTRIREALLNASFHDDVAHHLRGVVADGWLRDVLEAACNHIGLTEETTT